MGKEYKYFTKKQLDQAKKIGLSHSNVVNRINSGWTVEEALTKPKGKRKGRLQSKYFSKEELKIAQANNIPVKVLNKRRILGWERERIITQPLQKRKSEQRIWTDEEEAKLSLYYEEYNLKISIIAKKLKRTNKSIEHKVAVLGMRRGEKRAIVCKSCKILMFENEFEQNHKYETGREEVCKECLKEKNLTEKEKKIKRNLLCIDCNKKISAHRRMDTRQCIRCQREYFDKLRKKTRAI